MFQRDWRVEHTPARANNPVVVATRNYGENIAMRRTNDTCDAGSDSSSKVNRAFSTEISVSSEFRTKLADSTERKPQ